MLNLTDIVFIVLFALDAVAIITGNLFTIVIFWSQRFHLKRTCFLLINLAVADLLVGITEPIVLGTEKIPRMKAVRIEDLRSIKNPSSAFQVLGSSMSVIFLALISLERVHAVLRPLRHRTTNTCFYSCGIVVVWTAGLCMTGITLLAMYHTDVDRMYGTVIIHSFLFICVLVICASYLAIRTQLRCTTLEIEVHEVHNHKLMEQNLRLSRTFFIVAAVSLVFWLPAIVVYTIKEFCKKCFSPTVVQIVNFLHLTNSMINPFVYSLRMPVFKNTLNKWWRKHRNNIELRPIPTFAHNL